MQFQRLFGLDVAAAAFQGHHKLDLMMHIFGQRRIRHSAAVRNDGVGRLGKKERRLADVLPHLLDVLDVIAADAP